MELKQTIEWTEENVKNFWNFYAQFPEMYFTYQYGEKIVSRLSKYLRGKSNVLDYGCGTGYLIAHLLNSTLEVTGVDFSEDSIEVVNNKFKSKNNFKGAFQPGDIVQNENLKNKFEIITLIEVIEHLDDYYLEETIANLKKLVSQNGIVIFTTPNDENLQDSLVYCPESKKVFHRWQHVRSWSATSLEDYLSGSGFKTIAIFTTDFSREKNLSSFFQSIFVKKKYPHLVFVCSL